MDEVRKVSYPGLVAARHEGDVTTYSAWEGLAYSYSDREIQRAMLAGESPTSAKARRVFEVWECKGTLSRLQMRYEELRATA